MAKRLTDTDKWKDEWYLSLSNDYKIIWQWLLDNCSHSGFCKPSVLFMNMLCKVNITEEDVIGSMDGRVLKVNKQWFIPKFIKFQYPTLISNKPVIVSVVKDIICNSCQEFLFDFGEDYTIIEKSLPNHLEIIKDKDKYKDKVKEYNTLHNLQHNQVRLIGEEKKLKNENEIPLYERDGLITAAKRREIAERFKAEYPERCVKSSQS